MKFTWLFFLTTKLCIWFLSVTNWQNLWFFLSELIDEIHIFIIERSRNRLLFSVIFLLLSQLGFFFNFYSVYFIIILLYFILHFQRNSGISGDIDIYDYMNTTSLLEKKFHILNFCVQFSIKLIPFQSKLIQVMKKRMHIMDQEIMAKIL